VAGDANDFFADTDFRFRFAEMARVGDEETGRACMLFRFDLPSKRSARSFRSVGTNILDGRSIVRTVINLVAFESIRTRLYS